MLEGVLSRSTDSLELIRFIGYSIALINWSKLLVMTAAMSACSSQALVQPMSDTGGIFESPGDVAACLRHIPRREDETLPPLAGVVRKVAGPLAPTGEDAPAILACGRRGGDGRTRFVVVISFPRVGANAFAIVVKVGLFRYSSKVLYVSVGDRITSENDLQSLVHPVSIAPTRFLQFQDKSLDLPARIEIVSNYWSPHSLPPQWDSENDVHLEYAYYHITEQRSFQVKFDVAWFVESAVD